MAERLELPGLPGGLTPGQQVAGYRIGEQLAAGPLGVVFSAVDQRLGRRVALKVLAPALAYDVVFRERFIRETRVAAALDDPDIIPVFDAGEAGGLLFTAMRLVPGRDAGTLLREQGPLPAGRVAAIISPVASALDAAHTAGLVHGDVKPSNMLADSRPGRPDRVYLSDFGLSGGMRAAGLAAPGLPADPRGYLAPEQLIGRAADARSDQYALACAAFEMLTGQPPDQDTAGLPAQPAGPPPSLAPRRPELPPAVGPVFARALARTPGDRYPACGEFAEDLRAALGLRPYDADPGAGPPPQPPVAVTAAAALRMPAPAPAPAAGPLPRPPAEWPDAAAGGWADADGDDLTTVAFCPSGTAFAVAGSAGVFLCDLAAGGAVATLADELPEIGRAGSGADAIAYSPDGLLLAAGCEDGTTRLWDPGSRQLVTVLTRPDSAGVNAVAFSPDGSTLACGDENGTICLWDVRGRAVGTVLGNPESQGVLSVAFSPDGGTLAAGDANSCSYLWDHSRGQLAFRLAGRSMGAIFSAAFAPDGTVLAAADSDGGIALWDVSDGQQISALTRGSLRGTGVFAVAFRPGSLHLAAAYSSGAVWVWDAERARPVWRLDKDGWYAACGVAYSPDGTSLLTGHSDGLAILWDAGTGRRTPVTVDLRQHQPGAGSPR